MAVVPEHSGRNQAPSPARHAERILSVARDGSASARSAVAASWVRSLTLYRLDPADARPPNMVSAREFRAAREPLESLLIGAQPVLDQLSQAVGDAGCCVLLTDRNGIPIDRRGTPADDEIFQRWGLWPGAVWSEQSEGTNGIGTCLAEERALTIHRDQHFHARNIGLSCTVAPVYDFEGKLVASLDVSSCRADCTEGFVGLIATAVSDAARRIEAHDFKRAYSGTRIVVAPDMEYRAGALFAIDRDDLIVGATRAARQAYGITGERLRRPLPADAIFNSDTDRSASFSSAERRVLRQALAQTGGNVSAAAAALGISRATLHRKIQRLGLHKEK